MNSAHLLRALAILVSVCSVCVADAPKTGKSVSNSPTETSSPEQPAATATTTQSNAPEKAVAFKLEDQDKKAVSFETPPSKVTILLFADREGAKHLDGWIKPLKEAYGDKADMHGIAELSIVPGFAHGIARTMFRRKFSYSVMLDWDGSVSKQYAFEAGKVNAYIIDTKGGVRTKIVGDASAERLEAFHAKMKEVLDEGHQTADNANTNNR